MQNGLSPADRRLLLGVAALTVLMAAATAMFGPAGSGSESGTPSTYSSTAAGARAAYLLLQDLHYPIRRWEESPVRLPEESARAVLILAEPTQAPSPGESASLLQFIRQGGRVLFCGGSLKSFFASAPVRESAGGGWVQISSDLPASFTRGARTIMMEPKSSWIKLGPRQLALYRAKRGPVVVVWQLGRGELLWWAAPTPLTNAGITQSDNLNLFLNAVSAPRGEAPLAIYWDEYFHGERLSLWSYVGATPVKWAIVQVALIMGFALFAFSRRWGPVAVPKPVSRLSPLEFVDTLGGLYRRAGASSVAIVVGYRHLRLGLTRRLLLASDIPDAALAHAAAERLGWNVTHFMTILDKAAAAQAHNLRPRNALELVRDMAFYTARLTQKQPVLEKH